MLAKEKTKGFDIDLKFGRVGELYVENLFNGGSKIEVKTERDKWAKTGNIAVEIRHHGRPSGLSTTESDVWVHLLWIEDKIIGGFITDVKYLKRKIKELEKQKKIDLVMGGDKDLSQIVLLPIDELFNYKEVVKC